MTIPSFFIGLACVAIGFGLTFVWPIQRGRLSNQLWDFITLALFVLGSVWINYWDMPSNLAQGVIAGFIAILIRDFRLWLVRYRNQGYRRSHRYYWYGRARNWWDRRRRY